MSGSLIGICLSVLAGVVSANAETYSGVVTDSLSSSVLESVTVRLAGSGITALTDGSGAFSLETVSLLDRSGTAEGALPFRYDMRTGRVYWHTTGDGMLTLFDMNGKRIADARQSGRSGFFALPRKLKNGLYVLEATAGGSFYRMKIMHAGTAFETASSGSAGKTAIAADGTDTLTFSRAGYVYKRTAAGTGMAVSLFPLGVAATSRQSSVTWQDVTFTFDKSMTVGYFCNGDPFVVADQAFGITSISPDAVVINGYMANGTMMNISSDNLQGFDGIPADNSVSYQVAAVMPYRDSLNVDPAAMGHALAFASGGSGSVVKSVRMDGITEPGAWQVIDRYVVLTVLPSVPPAGAFRPPVSGEDKRIIGTEADLRWQVLRNGPSYSGLQEPADVLGNLKQTLPLWGQAGESLRRINVEGGNNYSRDYGITRAAALLALHGTASNAEKHDLFVRVVQHGIDVYGTYSNGWIGSGGAGQHHGYHAFLWFAAFTLESDCMLQAARTVRSNMTSQHFWVKRDDAGRYVRWPNYNSHDVLHQTVFEEQTGVPDWVLITTDAADTWSREWINTRQSSDYRMVSLPAGFAELLAVIMLRNGPEGETGDEALVNGPFDSTNYSAAPLAYMDRVMSWQPSSGTNSIRIEHRNGYDAVRDLLPTPRWTGRPDQVRVEDGKLVLNAQSGGFNYVYPQDISTLPVTGTDLRYSLDQRSWITLEDVSLSGSVTGLIDGAAHYVQMRQVNAAGAGPWSMNFPRAWDEDANGPVPHNEAVVTPAGSPAAALPVNTTVPVLCYRKYPRWAGIYFEPLGTRAPAGVYNIYCGAGYWNGAPAPSYTYQWLRDGAVIPDATEDSYLLTTDDIGTAISCRVTATNGAGTAAAVTSAADFIYDDRLDSNVVFESDFTNAIRSDVADFIASCIVSVVPADNKGMNVSWQPHAVYDGAPTAGAVYGAKTGGWPVFAGLIPVPAWAAGKAVRFRAHFDAVNRSASNALGFRVFRATATERLAEYAGVSVSDPVAADAAGFNFDETFTLDSDYMVVRMTIGTATGGSSGGSPYFSHIRVELAE